MKSYHQKHPGRRVIVWATTHYDTISAFVKRNVDSMQQTDYLPVENGAGIAISISKDGGMEATINSQLYPVDLNASV